MRIVTAAALAVVGVVAVVTTSVSGPASAASAPAQSTTARATTARPTTARPAAPVVNDLADVVCRTSKNCIAVGSLDSRAPAAVAWNGTAWHSVRMNLPGGAPTGGLYGVACPGTSECVAVGDDLPTADHGYNYALGDVWNGKAWAPTQVSESAGSVLGAVSCLSAKNCLAVGDDRSPSGGYQSPIAYAWNGAQWHPLAIPALPYDYDTAFTGVSCVTGRYCMVVGYSPASTGAFTTLLYRWDGKTWTALKRATPPKGVTNLQLDGVSCASATSCVAVGDGSDKAGGVAVAEVWNGKAWRATAPMAWPKGTTNPSATDVSCATGRYCVATGYLDPNPNDYGYTGRAAASVWNGRTWRATSVAAPGKGRASDFSGVTCRRPTFCTAVGLTDAYDAVPGTGTGTGLSAFWNGKSWRMVSLK
jgi:hypothetical protein